MRRICAQCRQRRTERAAFFGGICVEFSAESDFLMFALFSTTESNGCGAGLQAGHQVSDAFQAGYQQISLDAVQEEVVADGLNLSLVVSSVNAKLACNSGTDNH